MDSMMYTKEGEFEVALSGGSPWGFTIRTQSGNGYNRGKVIVAKVVQGGKADSSEKIHVGDEILAVNGSEFDNEQQATEYIKIAKKELILKIKRGQDKRRMNIRLANELPNFFAKALESPLEQDFYRKCNNNSSMFANSVNNKRSSKEFEKDLNYEVGSDTANAIIDYQSSQAVYGSELNRASLRLTRSSTDLSECSGHLQDMLIKENSSSSASWKSYNAPASPDKVQRVRIRSTNVTTPPDHFKKVSPENDRSSPTFDNNHKYDGHSFPRNSPNYQRPLNSSVMENLNRTWPSVGSPANSGQDTNLTYKSISVSAAKSHFEKMVYSKPSDQDYPSEVERSQKSSSSSSLAPAPPSRNSSFRSTRLSSSSFSDSGTTAKPIPENRNTPPSCLKRNNSSEKDHYVGHKKESNSVPVRQGSSSEDLDKPIPPKRFSQSRVLHSFRSSKKPVYQATSTGPSTVYDHQDERLESSSDNYYHARTQSLPSARFVGTHVSSKSYIGDEEQVSLDLKTQELSRNERLPSRSSSFSRARVVETSSLKTVQRDDARSAPVHVKSKVKNYPNEQQSGVIQALRTGEEISSETEDKWNTGLRSKSPPFLRKEVVEDERQVTKVELSKIKLTNTEVSKFHQTKREPSKDNHELSIPVLKENSIMQRLLMESQADANPLSKAAAIKQEISQRSHGTSSFTKRTSASKLGIESSPLKQQRPVMRSSKNNKAEDINVASETLYGSKNKEDEYTIEESERPEIELEDSKNVKQSAVKVDRYLDKLMVKLDSPAVQRRLHPNNVSEKVDSSTLVEDDVFHQPFDTETETTTPPVETEAECSEKVAQSAETAEVSALDLGTLTTEEDDMANSCSEIIVESNDPEPVVESFPPTFIKDNNDNISASPVVEKAERQMNERVKIVELKDPEDESLSPLDNPLKVIHSRENSASSILEETLESARTIASIYSVQGPTRSAEGDDSLNTASEMRRYSLAKRVVRKKTKIDHESFSMKQSEVTDELEQSISSQETPRVPFNEPESPGNENEADVDENSNRSVGSASSSDSRPGSDVCSPRLEALEEQKEILISSMKKKVELLKEQENEISEEMKQNDHLGKRVAENVKTKTSGSEFSKFELFVGELNNIIGLLLSLTQRMHRYEVMLQDIDLAEEDGREKRDKLLKLIDRVKQQYEEACRIKEINDKRGETVAKFVEEYCSDEEFADFQHFVDMKTQLALTQAEIRDKIKLGEEKLNALTSAQIDWSSFDLSSK